MAEKVLIEFQIVQKGKKISVVQKETDKLAKSTDKAEKATKKNTRATDKYNRVAKGAAGISSNQTKNFSKMQQSVDGGEGGGSGGLVRAYALLAANVFALSAAFGVLSRSAQVDTLTASIERLEIVSGKSIRSVARDLQEASGFSLDFASSLRSTSLALSAGFEADSIKELGEVAKNAAVSLGRPLSDALDRIFRGVIKVEPELLDEIGLFVRVDEAASRYADSIGVATSELTEFQKRTAFAQEAIEQGTKKFQAFADIDPDAFAKLGASFFDLAQEGLSLVNRILVPIITYLEENKGLLIGLFAAIGLSILKSIVPAMGQFRLSARKAAIDATEDFKKFKEEIADGAAVQKANAVTAQENAVKADKAALKTAQSTTKKTRAYQSEAKGLKLANAELAKASTLGEKSAALDTKIIALEKSKATAKGSTRKIISDNIAALKAEKIATEELIASELKLTAIQNTPDVAVKAKKGSFMNLEEIRLQKVALRSLALENVSTTASNEGLKKGFARLKLEMAGLPPVTAANAVGFGTLARTSFFLSGALTIVSIKLSELMMKLAPFMPIIMALVLAFPMLTKAMGFGSKAAEEYSAALDKTAEMLDNFSEKLEHARETLTNAESPLDAQVDAQIAFRRAISETSQTLLEQQKAYDKYVEETNGFVRLFGDFMQKGKRKQIANEGQAFADILENLNQLGKEGESIFSTAIGEEQLNIVKDLNSTRARGQKELIASKLRLAQINKQLDAGEKTAYDQSTGRTISLYTLRTREGKKQQAIEKNMADTRKTLVELGEDSAKIVTEEGSLFKVLAEQQLAGADAMENSKSAIDGAVDSARAFKKQFLTKSDVDKPLASFRQISTALEFQNDKGEKTNLLEKDRLLLLERIADEKNDIIGLMSKENREAFLNTESSKERLKILKAQRDTFAEARVVQIANKNLLNEIKQIQSIIQGIEKESIAGIKMKHQLLKEEAALKMVIKETELDNTLIAANLTKEQVKSLSKLEVNADLLSKIVELGGKEGEGLTAVLKQRELNNEYIKEELRERTRIMREELDFLDLQSKRLKSQEQLNAALLEGRKLDMGSANFAGLGNRNLTFKQQLAQAKDAETTRLKTAKDRLKIEKSIFNLKFLIIKEELAVLKLTEQQLMADLKAKVKSGQMLTDEERLRYQAAFNLIKDIDSSLTNISTAQTSGIAAMDAAFQNAGKNYKKTIENIVSGNIKGSTFGTEAFGGLMQSQGLDFFNDIAGSDDESKAKRRAAMFNMMEESLLSLGDTITEVLGKDGILLSAMATVSANLIDLGQNFSVNFKAAETGAERTAVVLAGVASALSATMSLISANTQQQVNEIDQLIDAEKTRDGKSKESVEKMKQMEKQKEKVQRKAFDVNKKLMIAQAIASTAAGIAATIPLLVPPTTGIAVALMAMMGTIGAAQVALISKLSFQGGASDTPAAPSTALSIGQRSSNVDVAQNATGGELNYLRGGNTSGTNLGGAGGAMGRKGYANGGEGIVVGERGPEVITPASPVDITPNFALGGGTTNVNFSINAVDATGVEDLLVNQRGNIIRMIREAANENGEDFLTQVDPMAYGSNS